jgi:long-chain fatty acid transport protein
VRVLVLLVLAAGAARANPMDAFGWGGRAPAMGGAATAAAREAAANYYNPGALAVGDAIRLDLGYQAALPRLTLNGGDQDVDHSRGLIAGVVVPGDIGPVHVAVGVGVHLPDERLVRTRTLPAGRPRWMYYDNRPQRFFLSSNVAVQIGESLFVGGGVSYMSRTQGAIELTGRVGFPVSADSDLALEIDVRLKAIRYPQAGVLWRARPWLDVGLTYRGGFSLQIDQQFTIRGSLGPDGRPPIVDDAFFQLRALALDLFQAEQLAGGFSLRATPRLTVTGDLTFQRWSEFANPASRITIEYDLKEFNDLVELPTEVPLEKTYFHDTWVPRLGVEVKAVDRPGGALYVRGGYAYEPSPAPEQRGETNFVDNDKHTLSTGLGLEVRGLGKVLPRPFDIDLFVAGSLLPERSHRKLSLLDPVGDFASRGLVLAGGIASRWRF